MLRLLEYRQGGRCKSRIGKQANRHADYGRGRIRQPIHGRAASRAKMQTDLAAALSRPNEFCRCARNFNAVYRIEGICTERRTCSPLTGEAVAQCRKLRQPVGCYCKISACALSIGHGFLLYGEIASSEMEWEYSPNGQSGPEGSWQRLWFRLQIWQHLNRILHIIIALGSIRNLDRREILTLAFAQDFADVVVGLPSREHLGGKTCSITD